MYIYWYEAISAINWFKQLKLAFKLTLPNFKIFDNCKIFVYLPNHKNRPTA